MRAGIAVVFHMAVVVFVEVFRMVATRKASVSSKSATGKASQPYWIWT
jgi:hypothetical protein